MFVSSSLNIAMLDAGTFKAILSAKYVVLYECTFCKDNHKKPNSVFEICLFSNIESI